MTKNNKTISAGPIPAGPIYASMEIIWHLTCGHCHYYWTYPTMNSAEKVSNKELYCPLCGTRAPVKLIETHR